MRWRQSKLILYIFLLEYISANRLHPSASGRQVTAFPHTVRKADIAKNE
jgi:hypothetical protein